MALETTPLNSKSNENFPFSFLTTSLICNNYKCSSFSSENLHFLDRAGQNLLGVGGAVEMLQIVKASLRKLEALSVQERLHLQIVLAILHLANPNPKQIHKLASKLNIPLLGFQTPDEVA